MSDNYFLNSEHMPNPIYTVHSQNKNELVPGTKYDVCGLVNAGTKMFLRSKLNCTVFRVPIVTDCGLQIIVEVWADCKSQEPRFTWDWRILQFTLIRGAIFKHKLTPFGVDVYFFKVNTSNRDFRFIWISEPCRNFWMNPVKDVEEISERRIYHVQNFDSSVVRGFLKRSNGSCFGKFVPEKDRNLHSHQMIGGLFHHDWKLAMIQYRRKYMRQNLEMMLKDATVYNDDRERLLLFHR